MHYEKNEKNGWYRFDTNNKKKWNAKKVELFWKVIDVKMLSNNCIIEEYKEVLNEFEDDYNSEHPYQHEFIKVIFPASIMYNFDNKSFLKLNKDTNIKFYKCIFLGFTDFELISKAKNITFNNCCFCEDIEFKQMEFNGLFLFKNCKVCKDIKFKNIIFKKNTSFIQHLYQNYFTILKVP